MVTLLSADLANNRLCNGAARGCKVATGFPLVHSFRCWILQVAWTTGARRLWRLSVGKVIHFHVEVRSLVLRRLARSLAMARA